MTDRLKNIMLVAASITALALGGSAIAGAASGGGNDSNNSAAPRANRGPAGLPPQRADETPLTGDTAAQVRKAALAKVSGGTIERVETDADGNAAYEAHMVRSDGTRVTVYVNRSFDVVSVKSGP
jgi:uncharacterized membrane protein YkoI